MKEAGTKAKEKIEDAKIGQKITNAAKVVGNSAVSAGKFVATKTKTAAKVVKDKSTEIAV